MKSISIKNFLNKFFAFFLVLIFVSCSSFTPYKVPILQGNIFDEDDMSKLSEGLTKEQVQFIFGTALIKDPFHSNRWDYYYSIQVGDELLDEMKLSINFNGDGLVDNWTVENLSE
tara:strand:+ start:376 stop:720 length:345 start_codon:yes stop_codon:yes gene_type:complete